MIRICRACEKPIAPGRLAVLPKASYCRDCQEVREADAPIRRSGVIDTAGVLLMPGETLDPAEEVRR